MMKNLDEILRRCLRMTDYYYLVPVIPVKTGIHNAGEHIGSPLRGTYLRWAEPTLHFLG